MVEDDRGILTSWLWLRGTSDRNDQGIDGESAEGKEGESGFGEHDDMKCREKETDNDGTGPKSLGGRRRELG